MVQNQSKTPLFSKLKAFAESKPISFHVPGHKNGVIFPERAKEYFNHILKIDMTELTGLDDLHAPDGVIKEAEELAAGFFQADQTFFLVNGSTSGNLAMILATCNPGDKVIVQRNSHKSILHALELRGLHPIFISPSYDSKVYRYTSPSFSTLQDAINTYPDTKAVILTYPDYFGRTYEIEKMIDLAHAYRIPVLVDEAHGVHFSLGNPVPPSSLKLGADIVVQSAHKMAPAMTMSSYLHIKSDYIDKEKVAYYLQLLQSSSPSYPLLASLDIARYFLANLGEQEMIDIYQSVVEVRHILGMSHHWEILPLSEKDDFLKITLHVKHVDVSKIQGIFEKYGVYLELHTHNQLLFVHGLADFKYKRQLEKAVLSINEQLKIEENSDTIDITGIFMKQVHELELSYPIMNQLSTKQVPLENGIGYIAAESVIPYPPGIPLILKGEKITETHLATLKVLLEQGVTLQQRHSGFRIYLR